jgi:hypothetical protein
MHQGLIRVSRRLFAFQIFAIVRSKPGLAYLLNYVPENAAAKPTASLDR